MLAILMMMEWCVPVCDSSFRQALSGERWVRRLVEFARKDASEKLLVRATVSQLLVNWHFWYGTGFEAGVNMLQREGSTSWCTALLGLQGTPHFPATFAFRQQRKSSPVFLATSRSSDMVEFMCAR